jgi:hypothetical protein
MKPKTNELYALVYSALRNLEMENETAGANYGILEMRLVGALGGVSSEPSGNLILLAIEHLCGEGLIFKCTDPFFAHTRFFSTCERRIAGFKALNGPRDFLKEANEELEAANSRLNKAHERKAQLLPKEVV